MTVRKNRTTARGSALDWLNYHHLFYFRTVVHEGGVTRAGRRLRLSPSTVSAQVRMLEQALGQPLFERRGRRLELTAAGRTVYRYAEQIFSLGRELTDVLHGDPEPRPLPIAIGVADVLPKLIAYRLLAPALALDRRVRLVVREGRVERLCTDLALGEVDLVLADAPAGPGRGGLHNHVLGESGVSFFAVPALAAATRAGFPASLHGAPMVLPLDDTSLRRSLDRWFDAAGLRPNVVGEFEDGALLSAFAQAGAGLFAAPSAIEPELVGTYGFELVGRVDAIRTRFYAITAERAVENVAVAAIVEAARRELFA